MSKREYSKDSFERFGDDLCALVLRYLPKRYEHKHQYELVCKQWRRLMYNRHHAIKMSYSPLPHKINSVLLYLDDLTWDIEAWGRPIQACIPLAKLNAFLTKFHCITTIIVQAFNPEAARTLNFLVFGAIKHYTRLQKLHITTVYDRRPYEMRFNQFMANCGQRLREINIRGLRDEEMAAALLTFTPNLRTFYGHIGALFCAVSPHLSQLTKMVVNGFQLDLFKAFSCAYGAQIKNLTLNCLVRDQVEQLHEVVLPQLRRFTRLETCWVTFIPLRAGAVTSELVFNGSIDQVELSARFTLLFAYIDRHMGYLTLSNHTRVNELSRFFINESTVRKFIVQHVFRYHSSYRENNMLIKYALIYPKDSHRKYIQEKTIVDLHSY